MVSRAPHEHDQGQHVAADLTASSATRVDDGTRLFQRTSVVVATARALAEDHIPGSGSASCRRCGEPSPCATAVHAGQVLRLAANAASDRLPPPYLPAAPQRGPGTATDGRPRLGLFDETADGA